MKEEKKSVGRPPIPPVCEGDCFNCVYDDCILTDTELRRIMRKPRAPKPKRKITPFRIGEPVTEFKAEYILTPLPGSPEVKRTWGEDDESKVKPVD